MTGKMTTPASISSFADAFLTELNAAVADSARAVTSDIENTLHQKLLPGDKKKQTRQINTVSKGSTAYMKRVQAAFEKNFAKFELYVRRNLVMIPSEVAERVEELHQKRLTGGGNGNGAGGLSAEEKEHDHAHLSPQERKEKQLEDELRALRQQIRQLEEDTQRLTLEQRALEVKSEQFKAVASKLEFLEELPDATISPLKRTVQHVHALQQSLQKMEGVQTALEEDTRLYKRQKLDTRDTYRNLRQRYLTNTANVGFATLEDLQKLNASLGRL